MKIPMAIKTSGYIKLEIYLTEQVWWSVFCPIKSEAEITKAAQVDSANEPNKSALMPATSPTLSPTLSAIVAGFLGESYGKFDYTFPTRSAPTSAAFV